MKNKRLDTTKAVHVDIVSDMVCVFCVIGYHQLARASKDTGIPLQIQWHPFELNPWMEPGGENHIEYMATRYGVPAEETWQMRRKVTDVGANLGFTFNFTEETRVLNTFKAHQLIDWASDQDLGQEVTLEIFKAYFTNGENLDDHDVLVAAAAKAGLDPDAARAVLQSESHAENLRTKQEFGKSRGVSGVPTMIFEDKHMVSGAQGVDAYARILRRLTEHQAA